VAPGDPALLLTLAGEEKIPLPMMTPTTSDSPFKKVKLLFLSRFCCPKVSNEVVFGVPRAVYPAPEDVRGNNALLKSNVLETEYDLRLCEVCRVGVASSEDNFRELGAPDEEESCDVRP
jgi:hypothetical protein